MSRSRLDVAEVFRRYQEAYFATYAASPAQRRVVRDLLACRTAALGGHLRRCDACGHEEIAYNSCRNRHCPKCQARKQAAWLETQCARLLAVPYYHLVFTLPQALGPLVLQNKRLLYGLLFRAAAETLQTIAGDPRHLGARIGFTAVLHTWGQRLAHHPHLHCVVPGGGLSEDRQQWIPARAQFFLPVRVLSRLFRGKYLAYLRQAYRDGQLVLSGRLEELASGRAWRAFLEALHEIDWVVYAKPPFGSPEQVLKYLARRRAPGRSLKPAPALAGRRPGRLPLQGLPAGQARPRHASGSSGVHAALPAARAAQRLRPHPPLRLFGQPLSQRQPAALPETARCDRAPGAGKRARCRLLRRSRSVPRLPAGAYARRSHAASIKSGPRLSHAA